MHPNKYQDISRQDILFFFASYYYMGYCRLPARQDYWVQRQPNSCLPAHWMDGQFSCSKFAYVWRNISLDSLLTDEEIDNSVEVDNDGQFKPETEPGEFVVKTAEEDEDNDDDDDGDKSKKDEEKNDYYDNRDPAPEEEDDNELGNDNDDDSVDDETINEEDDDDKVKQEKWYYKAKFMLDWGNKFAQTDCVDPGFAISVNEMVKLFKG